MEKLNEEITVLSAPIIDGYLPPGESGISYRAPPDIIGFGDTGTIDPEDVTFFLVSVIPLFNLMGKISPFAASYVLADSTMTVSPDRARLPLQ
jgi:hypothetical protein